MITWAKSWYVLGVAIRFYSILFYFNFVNLEVMKTFVLIFLLGCFSFVGYSIHPIDPPKKGGETDKTVAPPIPVATDQCSESRGDIVEVTVYVTFTDCPDYDCEAKLYCLFYICVYDDNFTQLACKTFDPGKCDYTFVGLRAEEYSSIYARLVPVTSCEHDYNDDYIQSTNTVPVGGGDVYIDTYLCQD